MKASDYFAQLAVSFGVQRAYGLQGGAVVHLFDSLEQSGQITCHYLHHEESAALAATADAKVSKQLGLVVVTTGPGGTNALTGLLAAWQDSVPVLFVSGQVRLDSTSYGKNVRQVGSQEFPILHAVKSMTKYSALIRSKADIGRIFNEAREAALSGRPGPVWIDFPLDLQWQTLSEEERQAPARFPVPKALAASSITALDALAKDLAGAERPLLLLGHGIHLSNTEKTVVTLANRLGLPVVTTWGASDVLPTRHPLNGGVVGLSGQRGANQLAFAADLLVVLGANLSTTQVGAARKPYAPQARKIVITHDKDQLAASTVTIDGHIEEDLDLALNHLLSHPELQLTKARPTWANEVAAARARNRIGSVNLDSRDVLPSGKLSSNIAVAIATEALSSTHDIVVDGGGTALYAGFQSATRGLNRRLICSTGISSMGTGLAETVGVSVAQNRSPVLTIIGDGSFLMNIQDLASIAAYRLPGVILIVNNAGYLAIKHTQRDYLGARYYGTDERNGLAIPDFRGIVEGFGLRYREITGYDQLEEVLAAQIPQAPTLVLDVKVDPDQDTLFRQGVVFAANGTSSPSDLSEMWPFDGTRAS